MIVKIILLRIKLSVLFESSDGLLHLINSGIEMNVLCKARLTLQVIIDILKEKYHCLKRDKKQNKRKSCSSRLFCAYKS